MLGVLFASVVLVLGWAACRLLGITLALAPSAGLALLAVAASWTIAARLPLTPTVLAVVALMLVLAVQRGGPPRRARTDRWIVGLLALAAVLPAALLGVAFAGLDVPSNNHDGIFHVEIVDALRGGLHFDTWYPRGYHAAVAAVLGLAPWVDSARGTAEVSEGLTVLAPLAVFGLGRALGARPLVSAVAAVIQALTFIYPYDFHVWGGWPLGTGVVMVIGLWTAVLGWVDRPRLALAAVVGLFAGGILLTHGTEVYTTCLGLVVIVLARARRIDWRLLPKHLALAAGVGLVLAGPYLQLLLGWAQSGGAVSYADASSEFDVLNPKLQGGGIWVQIGVGALGAAGFIDLPVRAGLVGLGMTRTWAGLARGLWLVLVVMLLVFAFPNSHPLIQRAFAVTYPWLTDQRLLQVASIFASLLAAGGLVMVIEWLARQRQRYAATRPVATRWLSIAVALVVLFVAEGSGVTIYKSLAQALDSEGSFSSDDRVAMAWLRQHVRAGETLANDASVDAGIWAPYKADIQVLLPRSSQEPDPAIRQIVRDNIADLNTAPLAQTEACLLRVNYVYYGSRVFQDEVHHFPPPAVLAQSQDLEEAFHSGNAVVFKTRLRCG